MSDRKPLFPGEPANAVLQLRPVLGALPPQPDSRDPLAAPADDLIAPTLYALLPLGGAWRTPDGAAFDAGSRLGGLLRGFAGVLTATYRRLFVGTLESTAWTLTDSLTDWEIDFDLPDPCLGEQPTRDARLKSLLLKVRSAGTITPADFADIATRIGYDVAIDEPQPFTCGASECGGSDALGSDQAYHWIVTPSKPTAFFFECGTSHCGVDALSDFVPATALECLFRNLAPAWTRPIFNYEG